jgi:hypothetical protein
VLCVHLSGVYVNEHLAKAGNLFQPLIDAYSAHGCRGALIDARDLQVRFDTLALYRAGDDAAFRSLVGLRVALLAREDRLNRFFDTVVYNRRGSVRVFTDMDIDRDWLQCRRHENAQPVAPPNGDPAAPPGDSGVAQGPPSVS